VIDDDKKEIAIQDLERIVDITGELIAENLGKKINNLAQELLNIVKRTLDTRRKIQ
jgi:hypothetical protein